MPSPLGSLSTVVVAAALLAACVGGCSSSEPDSVTPFPIGQAMVYGSKPGGEAIDVAPSCKSDVCSAVRQRCGDRAYAEVILDRRGAIADVVCYAGGLHISELGTGPLAKLREEPDTVFVFDSLDDGADLLENATLTADNVVLYGAGAQLSEMGGKLDIAASGVNVRGIRIDGDVTIDGHAAKLSLVEIRGELFINADDVTLTESLVFGGVHVLGRGSVFVRNLFGKDSELSGSDLKCNLNQRFSDVDQDEIVDSAELGGEVSCG